MEKLLDRELLELIESLKETLKEAIQPSIFLPSNEEEVWRATLAKAEQEAKRRGLIK